VIAMEIFNVCGSVDSEFEFGRDGQIQGTVCVWICLLTSTRIRVFRTLLIYEVWWDEGIIVMILPNLYGENQCECTIDDTFCLSIDSTPYLSGGKDGHMPHAIHDRS